MSIYHFFCLAVLLLITTLHAQTTNLIYYVDYEAHQENDYIQVSLLVSTQSRILTDAIAEAHSTVTAV